MDENMLLMLLAKQEGTYTHLVCVEDAVVH